jgi:hypothetical protein
MLAQQTILSPSEWRTILAKLRRARLLADEDLHHPGQLDTHPLVREYFGEQLRAQRSEAWQEANRRLYQYYRALAPQLPETFRDMEPLFLAVICRCQAGLYRDALHDVFLPRIQRGNASFTSKILGARGTLLSALAHFFQNGRWGSPVQTGVAGQRLTAEDQLLILAQAGMHLTTTRGFAAREAHVCFERAEPLCHSLNRPILLYSALTGQWLYSLHTDKLTTTMHLAQRLYSLAQEQNDAALIVGACRTLAGTLYFMGDRDRATICDAWCSDLALRRRPVSCGRPRRVCPSFVRAMRRSPSGISERSLLLTRPWRKQSLWRRSLVICTH